MNSSNYRFTLNMHTVQSQISIPAMVGDTGRTLRISLSDGSNPYFIVDGCLAKMSIKTPTETRIEEFCVIEDNTTIVYPFSEYTCEMEGIQECDVTLYGLDGKVITSPRFTMVVNERVVNSDYIVVKADDRTAVDAMLAKEAERQTAEEKRKSAETRREEGFSTAMQKLDNALKPTFADDGDGNVIVSSLHLVDVEGNGNVIIMEVSE